MITEHSQATRIMTTAFAVLLTGLGTKVHANVILASEGQSDYTIVIDQRCSASEEYGAKELQLFLEQICGAKLFITRIPVDGPMILVGRSKVLDRLQIDTDFDALGDEGFLIKTVGQHLILAGGRLRGSMYACYEFLDKFLDCRWFTPGVSRIPRRETIELPAIDFKKIPILEYREPYYIEAWNGDWAARNRMNSNYARLNVKHGGKTVYANLCHTFFKLVPPDRYEDEHPEYFSLIDGKRATKQLCLTNPDVVEIATQTVQGWLRNDPKVNIVPVEQMDGGGYCRCEKCEALAVHEGSQSGPILHYVNQIADNIKDEFPNVAIETEAYYYSRKPPKHVRPRPNVIIRLASFECCFSHPIGTCDSEDNRRFREDIVGWSQICDRLYVWDYVTNFPHYVMPFPNLHSLQPNIRFFIDHNVKGILEQGNWTSGGGEFAELRSYILARCLWDPDCDWAQEMDEFLAAYYGEAAIPIRQYIDTLHHHVQKDNIHVDIGDPPTSAHLATEIIDRAGRLFDEAEVAVADDPVLLLRVKKDRLPLEYVRICRSKEFLHSRQDFEVAVQEFARVAKAWGISRIAQEKYLDERPECLDEPWQEQVWVAWTRPALSTITTGGARKVEYYKYTSGPPGAGSGSRQ